MIFTTDKQTLEDLNIFGKHGGDSIYNIFNRCITRGGAAVLEEMFRYPLASVEAINKRVSIIQSLAQRNLSFPFKGSDFDATDAYLANTDERSKLVQHEQSMARKLTNMIAMDIDTQLIYKGVEALTTLMKKAQEFVKELDDINGLQQETKEMLSILNDPAFAIVYQTKGKLSHSQIAEIDVILRFQQRNAIEKLLRHIFYLDAWLSIARVAVERQFAFAQAMPSTSHDLLHLQGVYHPLVKNAVPNNIHITADNNVIFLTGANMAGKSTFMKSVSIALYLAHAGFPVAAQQMQFAVLDGAYTTINLPDNLGMGASHFYAEVLRLKKVAQELSTKNLFVVFDELFRGTNVKDAYEATIAVTAAFAKKKKSIFVISTHIIEAGEVLKEKCSNIQFVYLPTRMNGNTPVYTYTLEQGITADRHGMVIINNERIIDILKNGKKKSTITTAYELHH